MNVWMILHNAECHCAECHSAKSLSLSLSPTSSSKLPPFRQKKNEKRRCEIAFLPLSLPLAQLLFKLSVVPSCRRFFFFEPLKFLKHCNGQFCRCRFKVVNSGQIWVAKEGTLLVATCLRPAALSKDPRAFIQPPRTSWVLEVTWATMPARLELLSRVCLHDATLKHRFQRLRRQCRRPLGRARRPFRRRFSLAQGRLGWARR
jgi:hypothetical protein